MKAELGETYEVRYLQKAPSLADALAIRLLTVTGAIARRLGAESPGLSLSQLAGWLAPEAKRILELRDPRGLYYDCFCGVR